MFFSRDLRLIETVQDVYVRKKKESLFSVPVSFPEASKLFLPINYPNWKQTIRNNSQISKLSTNATLLPGSTGIN